MAIGVLLAFGVHTLLGSERHEERALSKVADVPGLGARLIGLSVSLDELAIASRSAFYAYRPDWSLR